MSMFDEQCGCVDDGEMCEACITRAGTEEEVTCKVCHSKCNVPVGEYPICTECYAQSTNGPEAQ